MSEIGKNQFEYTREDDERDLSILSDLYRGMTQTKAAQKHGTSQARVGRLWRACEADRIAEGMLS